MGFWPVLEAQRLYTWAEDSQQPLHRILPRLCQRKVWLLGHWQGGM